MKRRSNFSVGTGEIGLILLAAGASRRMENQPKQLLKFAGETLVRRAARAALASRCSPVAVVLGASAESVRREIADLPVETAFNKDWASGLASSLRAGLEKLLDVAPRTVGVCVSLADQPLVDSNTLDRLVEVFERGDSPVVACRYAETVGVPAIFPARLFGELLNLSGDAGAKKILGGYAAEILLIDAPEAALDIDSPLDYERLTAIAAAKQVTLTE